MTVPITRALAIIDPLDRWSAEARAPTGPGRYKLAEFFLMEPPEGPCEHAFDKKGRKMQACVTSVNVRKEARTSMQKRDMLVRGNDASGTHSVDKEALKAKQARMAEAFKQAVAAGQRKWHCS